MSLGQWMGPARVQELGALWLALAVAAAVAQVDRKNDQLCLDGLRDGFSPSAGLNLLAANWTGADFPCESNASFVGLTCDARRVVAVRLPALGLRGAVSSAVSFCENLGTLDLSGNALTGAIPPALGAQLLQLTVVNLSANSLTGAIPDFVKAIYLHTLDLHENELDGPIPSSLGALQRLAVFDVSDNHLDGRIPYTLSNTSTGGPRFNSSSFRGNKGLFGYPLPPPRRRSLSVLAIVGIGLGSGVLSLLVSFSAVCLWLRATERQHAADEGKISQLMPENEH